MFAISTSWNAKRHTQSDAIINEIKSMGFHKVELSFKLTRPIVEDIIKLSRAGKIEVVSVHNVCPVPEGIDISQASPDYYNLASLDNDERAKAVALAQESVDYARRLGAKCLVVHAGKIDIKERFASLSKLYNSGFAHTDEFEGLRRDILTERKQNSAPYIDKVILSLSDVSVYAYDQGIKIGLENRYYIREIPDIDEFKYIFESVKSKNLYYWHDTGHAQVYENLGIIDHADLINRYKERLAGMHLHDVLGLCDHQSPPQGRLDFTRIKPFINKDLILVLEPHSPASKEDVVASKVYLNDLFFGT